MIVAGSAKAPGSCARQIRWPRSLALGLPNPTSAWRAQLLSRICCRPHMLICCGEHRLATRPRSATAGRECSGPSLEATTALEKKVNISATGQVCLPSLLCGQDGRRRSTSGTRDLVTQRPSGLSENGRAKGGDFAALIGLVQACHGPVHTIGSTETLTEHMFSALLPTQDISASFNRAATANHVFRGWVFRSLSMNCWSPRNSGSP